MRRRQPRNSRRICFVTGTRAEFGLMVPVLKAIQAHPRLRLQIVATGMHLDRRLGATIDEIGREWAIEAVIHWPRDSRAFATGQAISNLARAFAKIKPDIVLVVGDRVEALAAATAAHLSDIVVAHVHGGDRAMGQMDDSLRHATSKLAHLHFPATRCSAERLIRMGEDRWRVFRTGSPAVDGLRSLTAPANVIREEFPQAEPGRFAVTVLHPTQADADLEFSRAQMLAKAMIKSKLDHFVIIYPNNDPGSDGIVRCWKSIRDGQRFAICQNISRPLYLGLLQHAVMLIGNSSSGIIEAASFKTPVIDIGPRQRGRERSGNVMHVEYNEGQLATAMAKIFNRGHPRRFRGRNIYGSAAAGAKIAHILARIDLAAPLRRKIISY